MYPDLLDDDALGRHVCLAAEHFEYGVAEHFELIPVHDITVGRYLLACRTSGIADTEAMRPLGELARVEGVKRWSCGDCAGVR